jgi:hypothetical protein
MLQKDPKERISIEEIWRHPWMAKIDKLEMSAQDNADIVRVRRAIVSLFLLHSVLKVTSFFFSGILEFRCLRTHAPFLRSLAAPCG